MKSLECCQCQAPLSLTRLIDPDYDGDECLMCMIGGLSKRVRLLEEKLIRARTNG